MGPVRPPPAWTRPNTATAASVIAGAFGVLGHALYCGPPPLSDLSRLLVPMAGALGIVLGVVSLHQAQEARVWTTPSWTAIGLGAFSLIVDLTVGLMVTFGIGLVYLAFVLSAVYG